MNEMNDLLAHMKFHDARFPSPLLIMSRIVAEIQFVFTEKWKKCSELFCFFQFRKRLEVLVGTNKTRS